MPPTQGLKQRIRNGDVIVALRVSIDIEPAQLEISLGKGTFDLLYVDGQHSAFSDEQIVTFCAVAEELGLPVQFVDIAPPESHQSVPNFLKSFIRLFDTVARLYELVPDAQLPEDGLRVRLELGPRIAPDVLNLGL